MISKKTKVYAPRWSDMRQNQPTDRETTGWGGAWARRLHLMYIVNCYNVGSINPL